MHAVLDITRQDIIGFKTPRYIRVLGFRRESSALLHDIKKNASLPVFTNLKNAFKILDETGLQMLKKELFSSDLYYFVYQHSTVKNIEFQKPVVIV